MSKISQSQKLFARAEKVMPGGVNSPVRAFQSVGGIPRFIQRASKAYLIDADGNRYIDYVGSWGPMILGHGHPAVNQALRQTLKHGTSFGAPAEAEVKMAEFLCAQIPSLEKVRMVNSGTEAVMGALRVARGFTGRNKVLKFAGCYHGHADYLLVKAGSGALTLGQPDSLGIPAEFAAHTLVAPYNDLAAVQELAETHAADLAAIIVEPVVGNMGCVLPKPNFLQGLRQICDQTGALLVFDEVMTGFRVHEACAQGLYDIKPDLTTLGKIIGGGLPVGAYGGRKDIMALVSPEGGVYQAGTLSGNPLAMAAGLATLKATRRKNFYRQLEKQTKALSDGLLALSKKHGIGLQVPSTCGMLSVFFNARPVLNLDDAMQSNTVHFKKFFHAMLEQGIYLPPSPFEAWFIGAAHGSKGIAKTLQAADRAFERLGT